MALFYAKNRQLNDKLEWCAEWQGASLEKLMTKTKQ